MADNKDKQKPLKIKDLNLFLIEKSGQVQLRDLFGVYLVLRAREGDDIAQELLDVTETRVHDIDGNLIWPMEENNNNG